jgi:hypothetical protein
MYTHTNWNYCIVPDDDGHWFLIPSDRREQWYNWLNKNIKAGDNADWNQLEITWAQPINGPSSIQFSNPREIE